MIEEKNEITLANSDIEIAAELLKESDPKKVEDLTKLFSVAQIKKNAYRVAKLNELLDEVYEQIAERLHKRPGEISNSDFIRFMEALQNQIDKSSKVVKEEKEPIVQINKQEVTVNFNETNIDNQKVIDAVNSVLKQLDINSEDNVIDADFVENTAEGE